MRQVFISYSHDSDAHRDRVGIFAQRLRDDGVLVTIDADKLPGGPDEGWPEWSEQQVVRADLVLVVCTATYCSRYESNEDSDRGQGAVCEARTIRQLIYEAKGKNAKFRVVLFEESDGAHVPVQLRPYHRFRVDREKDYAELIAWVKGAEAAVEGQLEAPKVEWADGLDSSAWNLADRKDEFALLEEMATGQSAHRILLLRGDSASGKTVLLAAMAEQFRRKNLVTAHVDFKGTPALDDVLNSILFDLPPELLSRSPKAEGSSQRLDLIRDLQQATEPVLLIFDTYEQASADAQKWLEGQFLARLHSAPALLVVVAGQSTPDSGSWWSLARAHELPPIEEVGHWLEYSQTRWANAPISYAHVQAFTLVAGGRPSIVCASLEALAKRLPPSQKRADRWISTPLWPSCRPLKATLKSSL